MQLYTQRLTKNDLLADQTDNLPTLALPFDTRQKSRFRATLNNGEAVGVDLPRTGVLRDGDIIETADGAKLKIIASPQEVMQVTASKDSQQPQFDLMRGAYHLGNRHVPLMLTPEALYFEPDHVLGQMLEQLGLTVRVVSAPFEPETGAYGQHSHGHSDNHSHSHSHDHNHSHNHAHNHSHSHD